jgi:hypothetical protein
MPGAIIAFDQPQPSTPSFGSPGVARNDLWQSRIITARCTTGGNISFAWQFLDIPPGSAAVLSSTNLINTTWNPDLPGTYRVQLITNGGGPGNVQVLVAVVRFDTNGNMVNRGWRLPGLGEVIGEQNFMGQTRGWDEAFQTIYFDLLQQIGERQQGLLHVNHATPGTLTLGPPTELLIGLCDSTTGTCDIAMPNPSSAGIEASVIDDGDDCFTNNITVHGNGKLIEDPYTPGSYNPTATLRTNSISVDWMDTGVHWKIR